LYAVKKPKTMRIFFIEDEEKLVGHLKNGLEQEGYLVDYRLDGEAGQEYIELNYENIDLIVLDVMLPTIDGITVCKNLRQNGISVPIIMLTARDSDEDKIEGLNAGADDYLIKPFSYGEFLARIRALLRRQKQTLPTEVKHNDLLLNEAAGKIFIRGEEIKLTLKEFMILSYFMRHPNVVVSREDLIDHLWDMNFDSFSNVVDVHVKNIRKKIKRGGNEQYLETIRGVGYRFKV
jgi:DNA-binding response OmpR family regulator